MLTRAELIEGSPKLHKNVFKVFFCFEMQKNLAFNLFDCCMSGGEERCIWMGEMAEQKQSCYCVWHSAAG